MINIEQAFALMRANCAQMDAQEIAIRDGLNKVLHRDACAAFNHPAYDVSAMDGYAVRFDDCQDASTRLRVQGMSAAGADYNLPLKPAHAVRIFTGAAVPKGADSIIIQENIIRNDDQITLMGRCEKQGQFIRKRALDYSKNDVLLRAGTRVNMRALALLASCGLKTLCTKRVPIVGILASGKELVEIGAKTKPEQIVSSNSLAIEMMANAFGGIGRNLGIADDNLESICAHLEAGNACDIIVTSGGASVGEFDLVPQALANLGYDCIFSKIAMRPGKPVGFYKRNRQLALVLPGNPVSTFIGCAIFLRLCLANMLGIAPFTPLPVRKFTLGHNIGQNDARQDFLRATINTDTIYPSSTQDSSQQRILTQADAFIIREAHAKPAQAGEQISAILCSDLHSCY